MYDEVKLRMSAEKAANKDDKEDEDSDREYRGRPGKLHTFPCTGTRR